MIFLFFQIDYFDDNSTNHGLNNHITHTITTLHPNTDYILMVSAENSQNDVFCIQQSSFQNKRWVGFNGYGNNYVNIILPHLSPVGAHNVFEYIPYLNSLDILDNMREVTEVAPLVNKTDFVQNIYIPLTQV